ncbi:unnamed protein product, partial [Didymodactylos carnosus]
GVIIVINYELNSVKIDILICYDIEFPEPMRCLTLMGAQLILVSTALVKDKDNVNVDITTKEVVTRAMKNHVWIAYSNLYGLYLKEESTPEYCGLSYIVSPDGKDLRRAKDNNDNDELITVESCPQHYKENLRSTPYLVDRRTDLFQLIANTNMKFVLPDNYSYH